MISNADTLKELTVIRGELIKNFHALQSREVSIKRSMATVRAADAVARNVAASIAIEDRISGVDLIEASETFRIAAE